MRFFLLKYSTFIIIIASLAIGLLLHTASLDTKGITISNDYSSLECAENIIIEDANSSYKILGRGKSHILSFESYICTIDKAYNESDKDRAVLYSFSNTDLELWTIKRPDIAQYFYRKIIKPNPNDALSLHIKREKLIDYNNQ